MFTTSKEPAGRPVAHASPSATEAFPMPEEFEKKLKKSKTLKAAFEGLTPGRQRAYLLYFAAAKQSATRESRIEKYTQQILDGKGLND